MARVLALYKMPKDKAHFDNHYFDTHVPLAKKLPGLRKYEVSKGAVASPVGQPPYYLVAVLHFDNMAAIQSALGSAEGRATAADLGNFASGGVDLMMYEDQSV